MYHTRQSIHRFTYRLYRFLEDEHTVKFEKMKTLRGHITVDRYPTTVKLDHRDQILSTLVHEILHYLHPEKDEAWILEMEARILNRLSAQQVKNIIKRLAEVL